MQRLGRHPAIAEKFGHLPYGVPDEAPRLVGIDAARDDVADGYASSKAFVMALERNARVEFPAEISGGLHLGPAGIPLHVSLGGKVDRLDDVVINQLQSGNASGRILQFNAQSSPRSFLAVLGVPECCC